MIFKSSSPFWGEVGTELIHSLPKWIQERDPWTIPDWSAITHSSQGYILPVKRVQQQDIPFTYPFTRASRTSGAFNQWLRGWRWFYLEYHHHATFCWAHPVQGNVINGQRCCACHLCSSMQTAGGSLVHTEKDHLYTRITCTHWASLVHIQKQEFQITCTHTES